MQEIRKYRYEEIQIGQQESFCVTVTEEMLESFYEITKDSNPLHRDAAYAATRGYVDRVVYGMLTASFFSTFAGVYLPGKYSLIHSVETKFLRPVYVGDELTITGTVKEKEDAYHMLIVQLLVRNRQGDKVVRGKMQIKVLDQDEGSDQG